MTPRPSRKSLGRQCLGQTLAGALLACALGASLPAARAQESRPDSGFSDATKTVVLLGNGLIEESQTSGYIEARLTRRFPGRRIVFRNLGWTGDTVWARARTSGFQNPSGLDRLKKQTAELKPDLIIVGYGLTESFDGAAGLERFSDGYGKLLDLLSAITPHLVLLSPAPHEDLGRPYPDPSDHNRALEAYGAAVGKIAAGRHLPFVDLFHPLAEWKRAAPELRFSTNGILLGDAGYWRVALEIERQLGLSRPPWKAELSAAGAVAASSGSKISDLVSTADRLEWKALEEELPAPPAPTAVRGAAAALDPAPVLAVAGLKAGEWILQASGKEIARASAEEWAKGVGLSSGPSFEQVESMRHSIAKRNNLYTRRWRPINDWPAHYTYIAPDYPLYDGLVAQEDDRIASQAQPVAQSYTLSLRKP